MPPGTVQPVRVGGLDLLVVHVDGTHHVLAGRCPHAGASLYPTSVTDCTLTCPWHGSRFDARTGAVTRGPATRPLRVYPASVEDGWVVVEA